jgi:phospholipid/cholesterol/gamma-HCH transport system ATP-binding protein
MSIHDNVAYGMREHFQFSEGEIRDRVADALESVGLPGTERQWPAELSGGQRKRAGLARALAIRPEVLLYDEPTTGLDPVYTERINQLIASTRERYRVTSIVVTHDMESAFQVSDRIAMIHKGFVIWTGTVAETRASEDRRVRDFIEGVAPETDDAATLLRYGG